MYRIKEIAKSRHITLKDIAEQIGITPTTLSRIIKGDNTTVETLEKIANVLEVKVGELFKDNSSQIHLIMNNNLKTFQSIKELKSYVDTLN